jgi:hypothetical protein
VVVSPEEFAGDRETALAALQARLRALNPDPA